LAGAAEKTGLLVDMLVIIGLGDLVLYLANFFTNY
jgi:hypothetical protein